jgi:TonB-linked SusC/RagA family outer membrane protein
LDTEGFLQEPTKQMYQIKTKQFGKSYGLYHKIWLVMRLTIVVLLAFLMQVSAATFGQKITINQNNATLTSIFKEIRRQSGYDFFYDSRVIPKTQKVNVAINNASLEDALKIALKGSTLNFEIDGKIILVKEKAPSFLDNIIARFQEIDVRGRILDSQKNPLPGATIKVKGTNQSVVSDERGEFLLRNVDEKAVLVIAYIGFAPREVNASKDLGDIVMSLSDNKLEEVNVTVSTGYQTLPKERATGSFNTIGKEQLDKPTSNIAQRLIGTTAGMQATLDADGNPRFEIRGQTSLNVRDADGNLLPTAAPLVVVDGFAIQGSVSDINPNDVESITILKDAAAASIWGAKSANGVIVIVTKKGNRSTPLKVSFSAFARIAPKLDLDYVNPLASSAETVDFEVMAFGKWGARMNTGTIDDVLLFGGSPAFTAINEAFLGQITNTQRDALLAQYRAQSNKKQIKDELLANPLTQQYNLSLSGGSERMSNTMSLLYEDNQSNFKNTDNRKYTFTYRTDADIFKWLQFNFSGLVNYNKRNNNGVGLDDIQGIHPYQMLRNEDGSLTNLSSYYKPTIDRLVPTSLFPYSDWTYNPIQEIANRKLTTETMNTRLQAGLKLKIVKGLTFDSKIQYELFDTHRKDIYNEISFRVRDAINTSSMWDQDTDEIIQNLPKGGILEQARTRTTSYNFRNQLNFDQKFGEKHELNFVGGSETSSSVFEFFSNPTTYGFNEQTLSVGTFPNGTGTADQPLTDWQGFDIEPFEYTNSFSYTTDRYFSLFGNAAYTYNDRYTLSGSIRTDASNLISDDPSYRYAPFWSVGLGWQLSKENFIKQISWIDRLSLRATYGYNGNVDRSTSFRPLIDLQATPYFFTGRRTANISSFGNPTLRWEKTGTWNLGLDYSLFKGALYGKIDVYNKSGKDLIAELSIPSVYGTTTQKLNNAQMINKGIELELGTFQRIKGNSITWRGNLNFAYNKNTITKLFVVTYDASYLAQGGTRAYVEGGNASDLWRYQYAGIHNNQPTIQGPNGTTYDFSTFAPGDGRTFLLNMGTAVAPYTAGLVNAFQIYDFNFSFIVTGKFGHMFQRSGFNYPRNAGRPNNKLSEVLNGDPMKIVPLPLNALEPRYSSWNVFYPYLSYLIESASHIRMQEVNLSYNLPSKLTSRLKMNRLQVFAQGNDLFTIVANNFGEDPEYPIGLLKPQARVSLGIKCEF